MVIIFIFGSQNADVNVAAAENLDDFEDFEGWENATSEAENSSSSLDGNFFNESAGRIHLEPEFLDGDLLKLAVTAEGIVSPIIGTAFHLNYDPDNIAFLRYDPGEFLEKGGDPFYLVKDDQKNHKIIFGETLRRDDRFPIGEGKVVEFYFQILNWDKFAFKFEKGVVSTLDSVRQDIDTITFEDLFLDKNSDKRLDGEFETGSENGDSGADGAFGGARLGTNSFNLGGNYMILFLVVAAIGSVLFLGFLIKKQEKKRQAQSVNFK